MWAQADIFLGILTHEDTRQACAQRTVPLCPAIVLKPAIVLLVQTTPRFRPYVSLPPRRRFIIQFPTHI
jgi:hypothetical protein